jgi:OmpA-OmpF porin, OOP family
MIRPQPMVLGALVLSVAALSFRPQTSPPRVPLVQGLKVVTAVSDPPIGDYESITSIDLVTADGSLDVTVAGEVPIPGSHKTDQVSVGRHVRAEDLKTGRTYKYYFSTDDAAEFPGTTAFGVSAAVIQQIRATGEASFGVNGERGGIGGLINGALSMMSGKSSTLDLGTNASGVLKLVEPKPVSYSVLLDGKRVTLPAWHLKGRLDKGEHPADMDCYILDDPANPIMLRYQIGAQRLEVVRIELPVTDEGKALEQALQADRRSILYGVYFDFNSANLKPQSDTVMREIVQVMTREPSWKLRIEGHTDSVGGDAGRNKELSAQRAEAVKAALVQRGISASRLDTQGFGATSPRETNSTIQGRARNRRVELTRE